MAYANLPKDYAAKHKRFYDTLDMKVPDQVPILLQSISWGYSYSQSKLNEVYKDPRKLYEGQTKFCQDIYSDAIFIAAIDAPISLYDELNPPRRQYVVSDDGFSLQHVEIADMLPEEYPELTKDPKSFIANVMLPRRFPVLNEPYPANYQALKKAYDECIYFMKASSKAIAWAKEDYGMPVMSTGVFYTPADLLFDFFRGFKGLILDIRKRPEEVIAACDVLADYECKLKFANMKKGDLMFMPLHVATYLNPKQFETVYWPALKKVVDTAIAKGIRPVLYLENDWTPYFDYLLNFPKNSITVMVEKGDRKLVKEKLGGHMSIVGGMPCHILRNCTKEECVAYARETLDIMAPGGGFVFSTDKLLLSPGDINVENYKAVVDVVRQYGKY